MKAEEEEFNCWEVENKRWERSSLVGQGVKDPAFSLLWHRLDPWPRNFRILEMQQKRKKKKKVGERDVWEEGFNMGFGGYVGVCQWVSSIASVSSRK